MTRIYGVEGLRDEPEGQAPTPMGSCVCGVDGSEVVNASVRSASR